MVGIVCKLEVVKFFGVDYVVDYCDENWFQIVKKLMFKGCGVDIVYDFVGMVDKSIKCIVWNGCIFIVGFVVGIIEKVVMNKVLFKNISLVGIYWGMYEKMEIRLVFKVWEGIMKLIVEGKFKGIEFIDKEFVGFEFVLDVFKVFGSREIWGKVVVKIFQEG